jgi:hypothetical protein
MTSLRGSTPVESKDVTITGLELAERGAVVPVGKVLYAAKEVKVTLGGCGGRPPLHRPHTNPFRRSTMADPMRIRAEAAGDKIGIAWGNKQGDKRTDEATVS